MFQLSDIKTSSFPIKNIHELCLKRASKVICKLAVGKRSRRPWDDKSFLDISTIAHDNPNNEISCNILDSNMYKIEERNDDDKILSRLSLISTTNRSLRKQKHNKSLRSRHPLLMTVALIAISYVSSESIEEERQKIIQKQISPSFLPNNCMNGSVVSKLSYNQNNLEICMSDSENRSRNDVGLIVLVFLLGGIIGIIIHKMFIRRMTRNRHLSTNRHSVMWQRINSSDNAFQFPHVAPNAMSAFRIHQEEEPKNLKRPRTVPITPLEVLPVSTHANKFRSFISCSFRTVHSEEKSGFSSSIHDAYPFRVVSQVSTSHSEQQDCSYTDIGSFDKEVECILDSSITPSNKHECLNTPPPEHTDSSLKQNQGNVHTICEKIISSNSRRPENPLAHLFLYNEDELFFHDTISMQECSGSQPNFEESILSSTNGTSRKRTFHSISLPISCAENNAKRRDTRLFAPFRWTDIVFTPIKNLDDHHGVYYSHIINANLNHESNEIIDVSGNRLDKESKDTNTIDTYDKEMENIIYKSVNLKERNIHDDKHTKSKSSNSTSMGSQSKSCLTESQQLRDVANDRDQSRPPNPMATVFNYIGEEQKYLTKDKTDFFVNIDRPISPVSELSIPLVPSNENDDCKKETASISMNSEVSPLKELQTDHQSTQTEGSRHSNKERIAQSKNQNEDDENLYKGVCKITNAQ